MPHVTISSTILSTIHRQRWILTLQRQHPARASSRNRRRYRHECQGFKVVVAYWKVKTPCHAHGEFINLTAANNETSIRPVAPDFMRLDVAP